MARTRKDIRQRLGKQGFCNDMVTGTASAIGGASGASLIDTTRQEPLNYFNGGEAVILDGSAAGNYRYISTWTFSTGTLVPATNFSAQIASGVSYEIHRVFSATDKNNEINEAIFYSGDRWPRVIEDTSLAVTANKYGYDLSTLTVAIDPTYGIDKVEYDPKEGTTNYSWIEIDRSLWSIRNNDGTLTLQFRDDLGFTVPLIASNNYRLTYRVRPPTLSADSGAGSALTPDNDGFYHFVCYKAAAILFSKRAQDKEATDRDAWMLRAREANEIAEKYLAGEKPQPRGDIIHPMWGESGRSQSGYNVHTGKIRI